ncbi:MAG TPA: serine hydrolase domain-containing protein [Chitinophagaceae bacterium]|nr:serine hydrolase domain-containing protein [Chitinophagaceae bacterium]
MPQVQFLHTRNRLKNLVYTILFAALLIGCDHYAREKEIVKEDDSLGYYPPTPPTLSKEEFRKYHRLLGNYFDEKLIRRGFNGGILVAKEGNIIYEKYTGRTDLRKIDTLTDSTALHVASVGKTFTAVAILKLVQENKLSLNDSLSKFFPDFPYPGITVKMLLNHRSGLPNYVYFMPNSKWDEEVYASNQDVLNVLYTEKPNKTFTAGRRFSYSNTNYILLAMIIEKISGLRFPDYMQQAIFKPLRMNHTYVFTLADSTKATQSFNYNNSHWQYDFLEGTYGDKNIYSTARDMLKWDQALYTDQLIGRTLLDSAFAPYSFERPGTHNYGLGFRLLLIPNGKKVIYHFGRWHGFNAAFARLTDEKVTIIIMGNKFTRNVYTAAKNAYDLFGNYDGKNGPDEEENDTMIATMKELKSPTELNSPTEINIGSRK